MKYVLGGPARILKEASSGLRLCEEIGSPSCSLIVGEDVVALSLVVEQIVGGCRIIAKSHAVVLGASVL